VIDYLQAGLFWLLTLFFLFRFAPRPQGGLASKRGAIAHGPRRRN
jgi:hypothetical protein